jgi:hypothetical protein
VFRLKDSTPVSDMDFNTICEEIAASGAQVTEQPSFGAAGHELWIRCASEKDIEVLSALTNIGGKDFDREIKKQSTEGIRTRCRIQGVDKYLNIQSIKIALKDWENLVEVTRVTFIRQGITRQSDKVILVFEGTKVPAVIRIGYMEHAVEILRDLKQCFRCFDFNHSIANCPRQGTFCGLCAEPGHDKKECTTNFIKCINCDGRHPARATSCPMRIEAEREQQKMERKRNSSR